MNQRNYEPAVRALQDRRIQTIQFHGAEIVVQRGDTPDTTFVAMKPVVEGMGMDWKSQHAKITNHPVLSKGMVEITIPSAGGEQDMTALPLNRLHFWMATLQPNKIPDPHVREKVLIFQNEAADALFEKFFGRALAAPDTKTVGGVVKKVLGKHGREILLPEVRGLMLEAITAMMPSMVESALASNARIAALEYVSVREMLIQAKAVQKGRGAVNRKIGRELRDRALLAGYPSPCRRCPHSGVWLFQRDFADQYMAERGNKHVRDHNDRQKGQTILRLISPEEGATT